MKTDKELYEDITERLDFEPGVDPTHVTYSAHDGVVILNGKVNSYMEKHLIVRAVRRIQGVRAVADEVVVAPMVEVPDDIEIATNAAKLLEWNNFLLKKDIKVTVDNGRVTLTGSVTWYYQKQEAENKVHYFAGVVSVDNQIIITPLLTIPTPYEVKEKIKTEIQRNALLDAENISVEIQGANILLTGTVHSWAESRDAEYIAWSIPGVCHVTNQILIDDYFKE